MDEETINKLVEILRPLKGTGRNNGTEDFPDKYGPDQPIRDVIKEVLKRLDVDGMGGCRVCGW